MTNPIFVVSSAEKSPDYSRNRPVNLSRCTCLAKDYHFSGGLSADQIIYKILFEGCVDDQGKLLSWGYATRKEQEADYDRILKAFAVSRPAKPEPEPEPVSGETVLKDVIKWLDLNATDIVYSRLEYKEVDLYLFMKVMDEVIAKLRNAMLTKRGEKK